MSQKGIDRISAVIGAVMLIVFMVGLAESISSGLAGFWGGLPFWVITLASLCLVIYDVWDNFFRRNRAN